MAESSNEGQQRPEVGTGFSDSRLREKYLRQAAEKVYRVLNEVLFRYDESAIAVLDRLHPEQLLRVFAGNLLNFIAATGLRIDELCFDDPPLAEFLRNLQAQRLCEIEIPLDIVAFLVADEDAKKSLQEYFCGLQARVIQARRHMEVLERVSQFYLNAMGEFGPSLKPLVKLLQVARLYYDGKLTIEQAMKELAEARFFSNDLIESPNLGPALAKVFGCRKQAIYKTGVWKKLQVVRETEKDERKSRLKLRGKQREYDHQEDD
jgi:hypothetical protein